MWRCRTAVQFTFFSSRQQRVFELFWYLCKEVLCPFSQEYESLFCNSHMRWRRSRIVDESCSSAFDMRTTSFEGAVEKSLKGHAVPFSFCQRFQLYMWTQGRFQLSMYIYTWEYTTAVCENSTQGTSLISTFSCQKYRKTKVQPSLHFHPNTTSLKRLERCKELRKCINVSPSYVDAELSLPYWKGNIRDSGMSINEIRIVSKTCVPQTILLNHRGDKQFRDRIKHSKIIIRYFSSWRNQIINKSPLGVAEISKTLRHDRKKISSFATAK